MTDAIPLSEVRDGARIANSMPFITAELEHMDRMLEARVFQALDDGTLTPDGALEAWQTKRAHKRLLKNLQTKVQLGIAAAASVVESVQIK